MRNPSKPKTLRKISNECCSPGCKERVWSSVTGRIVLYCEIHAHLDTREVLSPEEQEKQRRRGWSKQSGTGSFRRAQKKKLVDLNTKLKPLGIGPIPMSEFVLERLLPVKEDVERKKNEIDTQMGEIEEELRRRLEPLKKEHGELMAAYKELEKLISKMRDSSSPKNVTPIEQARERRSTAPTTTPAQPRPGTRTAILNVLRQEPDGLTAGDIKERSGYSSAPTELSLMKKDGIVLNVEGRWLLAQQRDASDAGQ